MNTELNRRRLLIGLAAASGAAATANAGEAPHTKESLELVQLGNDLPEVEARYWSARKRVSAILKEVSPIWPKAPEEIRCWIVGSVRETYITGAGIPRPWSADGKITRVMSYAPPEAIESAIKRHRKQIAHILTTKSKRGLKGETLCLEKMEKALPFSRAYVSQIGRIAETSGYHSAYEAEVVAEDDLKKHVGAIMKIEPGGMEGVVIQAQALAAWNALGFGANLDRETMTWPGRFAKTILKQAS